MMDYAAFLADKIQMAPAGGFEVDAEINPLLKGHQRAIVKRACAGGRSAIFAAFAVELNPAYFFDGCKYVEAAAREMAMPSLFDLLEAVE
ncbi:hypothetical protein [Sinorhizobium medicae]|uniref:hypothetical protein n=1 Tax=Sinorhizobium medicae TaxID=110321 RepID=UPI001AAE81E4|nr:hypothetical protein [Sinorhizobium medicae]MBO1963692.1 hypothetical protein [Sinorhizobium medicae]WQO52623.1 hypothetical protein U8C36_03030 [Sinorhizobium medicae]WQP38648.1 hypothetical protein U8C38_03220 [Sinorhizobium medicae]